MNPTTNQFIALEKHAQLNGYNIKIDNRSARGQPRARKLSVSDLNWYGQDHVSGRDSPPLPSYAKYPSLPQPQKQPPILPLRTRLPEYSYKMKGAAGRVQMKNRDLEKTLKKKNGSGSCKKEAEVEEAQPATPFLNLESSLGRQEWPVLPPAIKANSLRRK